MVKKRPVWETAISETYDGSRDVKLDRSQEDEYDEAAQRDLH